MERRSPKCPPVVEPNQLGCVWNFSSMLHHHRHSRPNQKFLTDESHVSKTITGAGHAKSQVRMLGFDEQLKGIHIEQKEKIAMMHRSKSFEGEISSSKHKKKHKEVGRDSCQMSMDIHSYDGGFCSQIPRKSERDSRLGKTNHDLVAEKNMQLVQMSAETFIDQMFVGGKYLERDCSNLQSRQFSDALEILNSNKEMFLKLLHDPNSLLLKNIQRLRHIEAEKETAAPISLDTSPGRQYEKAVYSMEVLKNTVEKSFWEKIKSRYEHPQNKKKKKAHPIDRIVVLKPGQQTVQSPVDMGCRCSYLQLHHGSTSKQQIVKPTHFSFSDITRKLRNARKLKNTKDENKNKVSFEASEVRSGEREKVFRSEVDAVGENTSQASNLPIVPYSKRSKLDIFVEARRHLAERLNQVAEDEASSSKQAPRTLERILLSSPKHDLVATLSPQRDGTCMRFSPCNHSQVGGERSSQAPKEKKWSGSGLLNLKQNEDSSSTYHLELKDKDYFLQEGNSNLSYTALEQSSIDGRSGLLVEFSLDVSSPKAECICKFENIDRDQYRGENPSPVSVLDPFFTDNVSSPTSTSESVEHQIHPRRLDFEEQSQTSSPPHPKSRSSTCMEDRGFISTYVNRLCRTSQLNWEEFLIKECPTESSCDHKLLYDCIKEVLIDLHQCYFDCSPWITFMNTHIRPVSFEASVLKEVMEKVDWHALAPTVPRTLEQLLRKDISGPGEWIDIKAGTEDIVIELVDEALQALIAEAILDIHF